MGRAGINKTWTCQPLTPLVGPRHRHTVHWKLLSCLLEARAAAASAPGSADLTSQHPAVVSLFLLFLKEKIIRSP